MNEIKMGGHSCRVNFLIAGVQKGGTTALDAYLREHPAISMAKSKEVHFFDDEQVFASDAPDYRYYHHNFAPENESQILGEATPIYMYWRDAPRRIWEYNPAMKFVIVLRNPIERAFSHWNMERNRAADTLPFLEALQSETERCRSALPLQHRTFSYIDRGYYAEQLRRIWAYFPKRQTLILRYEKLRDAPTSALNEVCRFLDVSPLEMIVPMLAHVGRYPEAMSESEWNFLASTFEYEIRSLERMLDWDCSDWLRRTSR
jgi:hypothetical protein